jgi:hypothetical protein
MDRNILFLGILGVLLVAAVFYTGNIVNIAGAQVKPLQMRDADWNYQSNPPHMFSIPSGNIGIGTTNPSTKLEIRKDQNFATELKINNNNPGTGSRNRISFYEGNTGNAFLQFTNYAETLDLINLRPGPIRFYTSNLERMKIDSSGNVGIGTKTPGARLDVAGEAKISGISGDGKGKVVCIKSDGTLGTCSSGISFNGTCTCN